MTEVNPREWLSSRGFELSNLSKVIPSSKEFNGNVTAMLEACTFGELDVCRFIFSIAEISVHDINVKGDTTISIACKGGYLELAQWLFGVGANYIRTKNKNGRSPMHYACAGGHLTVAQWLFEVGAASDIPILKKYERPHDTFDLMKSFGDGRNQDPPFYDSIKRQDIEMTKWLLLHGGATLLKNGETDVGYFQEALYQCGDHDEDDNGGEPDHRFSRLLLSWTAGILADHASFAVILLPVGIDQRNVLRLGRNFIIKGLLARPEFNGVTGFALRFCVAEGRFVIRLEGNRTIKVKPNNLEATRMESGIAEVVTSIGERSPSCKLHILGGKDESILRYISEFVGIIRGRSLRNVRQADGAIKYSIAEGQPKPIILPESLQNGVSFFKNGISCL